MLRNVWRPGKGQEPFTDNELATGVSLVANYGLNPFAKEVYVMRNKHGQVCTIVGIDGWIKIINRVDHFDGIEQIEEWNADHTEMVCVETRIHSKRFSRPTCYRGYAKEYQRMGGFVKDAMPWHMLRIFSLRHACRLFTPVGGSVVTEEEARWMDRFEPKPQGRTIDELADTLLGEVVRETENAATEEPQPANNLDDAFAHCKDAAAVEETAFDLSGTADATALAEAKERALARVRGGK